MKTVLVTGASSGFGNSIATLLAKNGYRVFGTSRNPSKAKIENVEMLELNVDSDESVDACARTLLERTGGTIDVLVNNAGYVQMGGIEETPMDEARAQLETNLWGYVRMAKAVLPAMRRQKSGKIINVGSLAGYFPVPFQGYYAISKFALEGFSEALRQEVRSLGIYVSIVEPGFFRTNIGAASKDTTNKIQEYDEMRKRAYSALDERGGGGQDPMHVAKLVLKIIETNKPRLHYAVGSEKSALFLRRLLPQSLIENQIRKMFRVDG
jgi:short-subunit dehydrogenase